MKKYKFTEIKGLFCRNIRQYDWLFFFLLSKLYDSRLSYELIKCIVFGFGNNKNNTSRGETPLFIFNHKTKTFKVFNEKFSDKYPNFSEVDFNA